MFKQNKAISIFTAVLIAAGAMVFLTGCGQVSFNNDQNDGRGGGNNVTAAREIDATDHVWGRPGAPIQMIVYSNFQCPFCADFAATMKKIEDNYSDKITIAFRHFLLASHAEAQKAAETSECAAEQGKFWQMHDKLFADNLAGRLSQEQSKKDASDLDLDTAKFNLCLDSGKYKEVVSRQMAEGKKAGVTGTPTSFINGRVYPGAYPFEDFKGSDGKPEKGMKSIIGELLQ